MKARSRLILKSLLAVAFIYHGSFNISEQGRLFWAQSEQLVYPSFLRWPVGLAEIFAAVGLFFHRTELLAISFLAFIMLGAILNNIPAGYSYKELGIEVPLVYLGILWVLFDERSNKPKGAPKL